MIYPGGGTGRHAGLKILFPATGVWVQLPSRVLNVQSFMKVAFQRPFLLFGDLQTICKQIR
jgi:hypothetical protein